MMTTEGDGNYKMQVFLESEGAEIDIQPITAWLLYLFSHSRWGMNKPLSLAAEDDSNQLQQYLLKLSKGRAL